MELKGAKVLVIGGAGFIGSHLVEELTREDIAEIVVYDNFTRGTMVMALGKPIICYIRECDLSFVPEGMRSNLPTINATPQTVYEVLKECLTEGKHELPEIGRRSRAYVERWHDPIRIAAKLKSEYEGIMAEKRREGVQRQ